MMRRGVMIFFIVVAYPVFCCSQASDTSFNQMDKNGRKQGFWKRTMNEEGSVYLYAVESYKDDRRNGPCVYFYPTGKKRSESFYRNDTLDGLSKIYRSYGGLRYEEPFKDGQTNGFKKYYTVDGDLAEEQEYIKGAETGIYRLYSKHGRVIVESFLIEGIENGTRKVYSDNDKHEIIREFDFKNDIKIAARYYKNGKVVKQEKYNYEDGLKKDEELKRKHQTVDG